MNATQSETSCFKTCLIFLVDVEESPSSAHKKHKKHKKKHKKKKSHGPGEDYSSELASSELGSQSDTGKPSIKLKIKIGGQTFGEKRYA